MKKLLLTTLALVAVMCVSAQNRVWDFSTPWTIDATTVDANLSLENTVRFDYLPATTLEECVFASGQPIPDVAGLKFTQTGSNKLRLGFGAAQVYLNGGKIVMAIPCKVGSTVLVEAIQGNGTATNRGFSVVGGTVDAAQTSPEVNASGVVTTANTLCTFAYTATAAFVELTTIEGGMNVRKITVIDDPNSVPNTNNVKEILSTRTFDVLGKEVTAETKGLVFVKTTYKDGTTSAQKIYRK